MKAIMFAIIINSSFSKRNLAWMWGVKGTVIRCWTKGWRRERIWLYIRIRGHTMVVIPNCGLTGPSEDRHRNLYLVTAWLPPCLAILNNEEETSAWAIWLDTEQDLRVQTPCSPFLMTKRITYTNNYKHAHQSLALVQVGQQMGGQGGHV